MLLTAEFYFLCVATAVSVNDPPVVANQSYSLLEDHTLVVSAADGLLRGSSDVDGDPLKVFNLTQPANGKITVQVIGAFVYVPNPNYNGQDSILFTVTDGNGGYTAAVATFTTGEAANVPG